MTRSCSQCDTEATTALKQEPLCREHAEERLENLEDEVDELSDEVQELEGEYNRLCEKFDVDSYGEIDHQLNVEERDIDEDDVQAVNDVESAFAGKREELRGLKYTRDRLKRDLN